MTPNVQLSTTDRIRCYSHSTVDNCPLHNSLWLRESHSSMLTIGQRARTNFERRKKDSWLGIEMQGPTRCDAHEP
jgi:hypothetical protein